MPEQIAFKTNARRSIRDKVAKRTCQNIYWNKLSQYVSGDMAELVAGFMVEQVSEYMTEQTIYNISVAGAAEPK